MNKREYSNLPEHLPIGKLAFNNSTNELFIGVGENAPLQKVTNKDIEDDLKDASVDYMGNNRKSLKKAIDSNVEWLLDKINNIQGEINIVHYEGQHITATDTVEGAAKSAILKGRTGYRDIDTGEILETFEEGRNLELVSVRMPGLTTTGKNFCSVSSNVFMPESTSSWYFANGVKQTLFGSKLKRNSDCEWFYLPDGTYTFSYGNGTSSGFQLIAEYEKYNYNINNKTTRTISEGWYTVRIKSPSSNLEQIRLVNLQIEKGSKPTSYEPYKSNILSCNEDVELRGIGDVKDTLDCLTGELTKRVGEVVLDGSETGWAIATNSDGGYRFGIKIKDMYNNKLPITSLTNIYMNVDKLPIVVYNDVETYTYNCISAYGNNIVIYNSTYTTLDDFKNWLSSNLITIQYQLATESIKTVDLSDNHVYSYKDVTHYDCSSAEGSLVPTLSIDVPTNLPAVVTRQRATIQQLELENSELKNTIAIVDGLRESGDLELLSSDFDLDFRLMEIEFALDIAVPMSINLRGVRNMARTPYEMAKTLILGGKYDRADMEYKLSRYLERKQITQEQHDELLALMEANDLV